MKTQPTRIRIGEGKISGILSIFFAVLSLCGVICFHFPAYFTTPEFRAVYSVDFMRWLLLGCLVFSFCFAFSSFLVSNNKRLGFYGIIISAFAIVLGGNTVGVQDFEQSMVSISMDWLLLDILVLSAIFIPLELFFPQNSEQTKFHAEWKTDLTYFMISHLFVQLTAVAVKGPAEMLFGGWGLEGIRESVASYPFMLQLLLAMLVADLFQYAAHFSFHRSPFLWRFHAIHHSIRSVDWIAGSRLHIVDILVTRSFTYIPIYLLGFSLPVFYAYVTIVALQAVMAHANVRIPFGPFKYLLVTPQYHHWHHCDDPELYDKNFAIHFPFIDKLFGTYYLPQNEWPQRTGLGQQQYPKGYLKQLLFPFKKSPAALDPKDASER
jgi:sterol desaturase/sphingolipid hydroxylase (fatty acid hydroxylase superfamily)